MSKTCFVCMHVHPENDDKEHRLEGDGKCWCKPTTLPKASGSNPPVYQHNSADGREFVEEHLKEYLAADKTWDTTRID